jgi:tetratricopeptide (TPR) repeat protein
MVIIPGFRAPRRIAYFVATTAIVSLTFALPLALIGQDVVPTQSPAPNPTPAPTIDVTTHSQMGLEDQGDLHMARRRYQAALQAYSQMPVKSAEVWNKIGIADQQLYLVQPAKKAYEASLKLDPQNPDVINNLGTVYYSLQQYGSAEKLYRKALKIRPKSALIYKNLGTALLASNKFKKGWDCYQSALAIDPQIFEKDNMLRIGEPTPVQKRGAMSYYLAKSYAMAGMTDLAVEYLRKAIDDGFTDRKKILADKELASLRGSSAFDRLLLEQTRQ